MVEPALVCQQLSKRFGALPVVRDVSLAVAPGQILTLLGPSGCGKTTTLRLIAGFEQVDSGTVTIGGRLVAAAGLHVPPEKRRAGMVFQDYAIFPHLTVAENVAFGLGRGADRAGRVREMLALVDLPGAGDHMPHELSGGQQQRVALARALAPRPAVLLLDEPFSNLDATLRVEVRREVRDLLKNAGTTAVFVTHDQEEALFLGDQLALMNDGYLEQVGPAEEVFHRPRTRFVAEFMGHTDFVPGVVANGHIETPLGVIVPREPLPAGSTVDLVVRPDDVMILDEEPGTSRILARQFLGIAYLYRVQLADGSIVHSWQSHQMDFADSAPVRASWRPGHSPTYFVRERQS